MPKISELIQKSNLAGTEFVAIQDANVTKRANLNDVITSLVNGGASVTVSDNAPASANEGDLWYDSSSGGLYVFVGGSTNAWIQTNGGGQSGGGGASVTTSPDMPESGVDGDLWFDETNAALYVYTDAVNGWVQTNGGGSGGGALGSFGQYVDSSGYVDLNGTSNTSWNTVHTIPDYDPNSLYAYTLINSAFGMRVNARHGVARFMNATVAEVQGFRYNVDMPPGGSFGWPVALVTDAEYADSTTVDSTVMPFNYTGANIGTPMDTMSTHDDTLGVSGIATAKHPGGSVMYNNGSSVGYGLYTRINPSNGNIQMRSRNTQGAAVTGGFMWFKLNTTTVPCYRMVSATKVQPENYTHS